MPESLDLDKDSRRLEELRLALASLRPPAVAGASLLPAALLGSGLPGLLLNSACAEFPDRLANRSGLVGKHLMIHSGHGVYGKKEEVRWYKGPPSMALTEHWNYTDEGKDFHGGYCFMDQGPLPASWASAVSGSTGLWGEALRQRMADYIHNAGVSVVGETQSQESNQMTLAEGRDRFGLPVARVTFSYCDNDRRLFRHALACQRQLMEAAGATGLFDVEDTAHLMGTCRMGADPARSVTDADGRTWDIPNLWLCDGSPFPTSGGVNPSLTIQARACRIGDRIRSMAARGEP